MHGETYTWSRFSLYNSGSCIHSCTRSIHGTHVKEITLTSDAANTRLHTGANTGAEAPIPSGRDKRLH